MSGGYFDYLQYQIQSVADSLESVTLDTEVLNRYSPETLESFHSALACIRNARVYTHAIDYLLSCDFSEDSYHNYLKENLDEYYARTNPSGTG